MAKIDFTKILEEVFPYIADYGDTLQIGETKGFKGLWKPQHVNFLTIVLINQFKQIELYGDDKLMSNYNLTRLVLVEKNVFNNEIILRF